MALGARGVRIHPKHAENTHSDGRKAHQKLLLRVQKGCCDESEAKDERPRFSLSVPARPRARYWKRTLALFLLVELF